MITKDGKVRDPKIKTGLNADFDAAALEAVKQWEYKPATFKGTPCEMPVLVDMKFRAGDAKDEPASDTPR